MRTALIAFAGLISLHPGFTAAGTLPPATLVSSLCSDGPATAGSAAAATVLLSGYGSGGLPISTRSREAQAFFDNGMQLAHAFSHGEATAAFVEARKLDADCAMCAWGEAWSRGPTINFGIDGQQKAELAALADKAAVLAKDGPALERQLTAALQQRYRRGDRAFAEAMDVIARANPDNNEIAVLTADAWLIASGGRGPGLARSVELIETVLNRAPDDTGAIHFYIHATEMSGFGARALPFASRLQGLAPSASHLVHMPSHTYYWVGQYHDAAIANLDAARLDMADARRVAAGGDGKVWDRPYHGHNVQFGIGGALMANDAAEGLALADMTLTRLGDLKADQPWAQYGLATAYYGKGRFGSAPDLAALADPGAGFPFLQAMRHYALGEAAARRGDVAALKTELTQVKGDRGDLRAMGGEAGRGATLVEVARLVLTGRLAMLEGRPAAAEKAYRKAAGLQESRLMTFRDPPIWWFPVRRSLAAALLAKGDAEGAAREAHRVLETWPADPMSLLILSQAERALGRASDADLHLGQASKGWTGDLSKVTPALI